MSSKTTKKDKKDEESRHNVEISGRSIFCYGMISTVIMVWIFALGVMAGQGYLPENIKALADIKTRISKVINIILERSSNDLEDIRKMSKQAEQTLAGDPENNNDKNQEMTETVDNKKIIQATIEPKPETEKKLEEPPAEEELPKKTEEIIIPPKEAMGYVLQIASLKDKDDAEKMTETLKTRGYPAYFYPMEINGRTYFRVRCGPFDIRKNAEDLMKLLEKKEKIVGCYVTKAD